MQAFLEIMIKLLRILIGRVYGLSWHQKHQLFSTCTGTVSWCWKALNMFCYLNDNQILITQKMGVVQRAISTMMYGNGANKQVSVLFMMLFSLLILPTIQLYNCLQPLMVCLWHNSTITHINHLAANFDDPVLKWRDRLTQNVQVACTSIQSCYWFIAMIHIIGLYWKKKCQGFMDWSTYHRCWWRRWRKRRTCRVKWGEWSNRGE